MMMRKYKRKTPKSLLDNLNIVCAVCGDEREFVWLENNGQYFHMGCAEERNPKILAYNRLLKGGQMTLFDHWET